MECMLGFFFFFFYKMSAGLVLEEQTCFHPPHVKRKAAKNEDNTNKCIVFWSQKPSVIEGEASVFSFKPHTPKAVQSTHFNLQN